MFQKVKMSTSMIEIKNSGEYRDSVEFINDPDIEITSEAWIKGGKLYSFNTNEEIFVPWKFEDEYGNDLIFGKDKTRNVVSVETDDDLLYVYTEENGNVECEVRPNSFWLLAPKKFHNFRRLKGGGFYRYIKRFEDREEFDDARKKGYKQNCWSIYNGEEAALVDQGITYFKGMKVEDVSVLAYDIEATGFVHNETSKTLCISNTFRKNGQITKKFFTVDEYDGNDRAMIDDWCSWVREMDPSVICGHNIFGYDFPYLAHCAGGSLPLGRDGSDLKFTDYTSKFRKDGSQTLDYHNARIHGREIIDTMFLSYKYDIGRNFPSYALKRIIDHLGLEKEDRQHYDASKIGTNWSDPVEREKIKAYAIDDADDALALYELMIPSFFYLNQSIPKTFQQIINTASGSQINAYMVRAYFQDGHGLPMASPAEPFEGAVSLGIPGVYDNVRKVDVASLYPSIMIEYKVYDKRKDPKAYFLETVKHFTKERLYNKKMGKETGDKYYKDLEQSQKIVINSMYGFLGAAGLLFNSPKKAAFVTRRGREITTKGVEWATGHTLVQEVKEIVKKDTPDEKIKYHWVLGDKVCEGKGYTLVNVDTDAFSYTDGTKPSPEEFKAEIEALNALYPQQIRWEDDGFYDQLIVVGAKNYVLNQDGKIKYKGSSLTDQKKEPALIELLHELIHILLNGNDSDALLECYEGYIKEACHIQDIDRWATKKTVTKAVLNPQRTTEQKVLNALQGERFSEGDKIWIYNAVDGEVQEWKNGLPFFYKKTGLPKMIPNRILKLTKHWDHDQEKMHYVKRVYDTAMILEKVLDTDSFIPFHKKKNVHLLEKI